MTDDNNSSLVRVQQVVDGLDNIPDLMKTLKKLPPTSKRFSRKF